MKSTKRKLAILGLKLFDLVAICLCFIFAGLITYSDISDLSFAEFLGMRIKISNFILFGFLMLTANMVLTSFNLYRSRRLSGWGRESIDIIGAVSFCTLSIIVSSVLFELEIVTKYFLAVFWMTSIASLIFSRIVIRFLMREIRLFGRNLRYVLIIGTNSRATEAAQKIVSDRKLGYELIGFVDNKWAGSSAFENNGQKIVADLDNFPAYLRNHIVDEVFICTSLKSQYESTADLLSACEEQGITVHMDRNIFTPTITAMHHNYQEEDRWLSISHRYTGSHSQDLKRAIDIAISMVALILLAPLFLIAAGLIKLDSNGPVFFSQQRIGLNKRRFKMYKFRTMGVGAEAKQDDLESQNEVSGPVFKISKDPRITRIGKILRSTSIDELPQLINVLNGDMALVGPRPLPVRDYEGFEQDWHRRRFSVKPGITCLWQVEGRSDTSFDEWMQMDLRYIDQWSIWLDIKILFKTIPAVIRGSGAY
jgi:exopolysaccharide biosynthesis polyprenyl glycosylphosphotransferase